MAKLMAIGLAALCLCATGADKKPKSPDVEIVEIKISRVSDYLTVDGTVRVTGEKPVVNLELRFDFLGNGKVWLATRQVQVDEQRLEPGDEADFHAQTGYLQNAVAYKIRAFLSGERELSVAKPGPYPILVE